MHKILLHQHATSQPGILTMVDVSSSRWKYGCPFISRLSR